MEKNVLGRLCLKQYLQNKKVKIYLVFCLKGENNQTEREKKVL